MIEEGSEGTIQSGALQIDPNRIGVDVVVEHADDPLLLLDRIVAQTLALVSCAEGASIELAQGDELVYAACGGTLAAHVGLRLNIRGSFSGLSATTQEILRCDDSENDPRVDRHACRLVGAVSMLCVPLPAGPAHHLGVLKITSRRASAFNDDDTAVLQALAPFITAAVATTSELSSLLAQLNPPVGANTDEQQPNRSRLSTSQADAVSRFAVNVVRPGLIDTMEARQAVLGALAPDAMTMHVQPIYRLSNGRLQGFEALARFQLTPLRPPDLWFNEAHRVGLGVELELAAVLKALALLEKLPVGIHLAINVGPATLSSPHLEELLESVDPHVVVLELTEHSEIDDYHSLNQELARYRRRGIKLSIDDTGTGVSGLAHILRLAPDYIKLDRELTRGIEVDPVRRSLAAALVYFAGESGAEVIAEGIENHDALAVLADLGVDCGQGYYLGRPASIEEMDGRPLERGAITLG